MSPGVAWLVVTWLVASGVQAELKVGEIGAGKPHVQICLNYFKMCPDHMDVPSTYDNLELIMDPEDQKTIYINGDLNMKEDVPVDAKLLIDVRRCDTKDEESCMKYYSHVVEDICTYLPQEDQPWSPFTQHIEGLTLTCPIPAGSYKMVEAPVSMEPYKNMTQYAGHWQTEVSFTGSEKRYGCILLDLTIHLRRDSEEVNC